MNSQGESYEILDCLSRICSTVNAHAYVTAICKIAGTATNYVIFDARQTLVEKRM